MKHTRKISIALVIAMVLMLAIAVIPASAATPETLYLTPNANWKTDNARFAAYFFGNGETWVSMTDTNGDGVYEVEVPAGYPSVIFCRMNPGAAANNWTNKWNQTADLTIPTSGANHYTVKEGTWDKGGGTWSTYGSTCLHTNLGPAATCTTPQLCNDCGDPVVSALGHTYNSAHLCTVCNTQATFTVAGSGAHLGTEWDTGNTANDMTYADGVYTKVYTDVAAGSYLLKVARDHDWGTAYPDANKAYTVATTGSTVTVTLTGTTVNIVVEAPHVHTYDNDCDAECNTCNEVRDVADHNFEDGVCTICGEPDPDYHEHSYTEFVGAVTIENVTYAQFKCAGCEATENKAVFTFKGGSIRYAEADGTDCPTDAVDIRFGYTINPEVLAWVEANGATMTWGWNYKLIADDNTIESSKEGSYKLEDGTTNVVFTNVPQKRLGNVIAVKMYVTINGTTLTENVAESETNYQERTTETVLNATLGDGNAAAAAYAKAVLDEFNSVTVYFQNNWMWSEVCCYVFDSEGYVAAWPGASMELFGNDGTYDIYSVKVPKGCTIIINGIKDDGSGNRDETPHITDYAEGNCYYMTWDNGNAVGSADISVILSEN